MVDVTIPGLKLVSEANRRDHWAARHRRVRAQKNLVTLVLNGALPRNVLVVGPVEVTITRISPRRLDDDNATISAKAVRDAIAAALGVNDGSDVVRWRVEQAKGEPAVRIEIRAVTPEAA